MTPIAVEQARKLVRALMAAPDAPKTGMLRLQAGGSKMLPARLNSSRHRPLGELEDESAAAVCAFGALPEEVQWAFYRVETARDDPRRHELLSRWGQETTGALVQLHREAREAAATAAAEGWRQDPEAFGLEDGWEQDEPGEPVEDTEERKTWKWLGGYVPKLAPVVETYLHSTDKDERRHAFYKLDKYRRKGSDGRHAIVMDVRDGTGEYDGGDRRPPVDEEFKVIPPPGGYVLELRGGTGSKAAQQAKRNALRPAFEEWAAAHGTTWEELVMPPKPGRPTEADRARLDLLAEAVREMRARGYTQVEIGTAIGRTKQRVAELEQRVS